VIAFQRVSTVPTVPESLRRDSESLAARTDHMLPMAVWCRPATIAAVRRRWNDGLPGATAPADYVRIRTEFFRPSEEVARMNSLLIETTSVWRSIQSRSRAIARSRRAVMRDRPAAPARPVRRYRVGTDLCLAAAGRVLAGARLLHRCGLIGPRGLRAAFACSGQLTRAAMRLWRRNRR
jgi:hypothetical protein